MLGRQSKAPPPNAPQPNAPQPNAPPPAALMVLKSMGLDFGALMQDFALAKEWLVQGLAHFKQRFDGIEFKLDTYQTRHQESDKRYLELLSRMESREIDLQVMLDRVLLELREFIRLNPTGNQVPDQTFDQGTVDAVQGTPMMSVPVLWELGRDVIDGPRLSDQVEKKSVEGPYDWSDSKER